MFFALLPLYSRGKSLRFPLDILGERPKQTILSPSGRRRRSTAPLREPALKGRSFLSSKKREIPSRDEGTHKQRQRGHRISLITKVGKK
jgi:hypothetical protein